MNDFQQFFIESKCFDQVRQRKTKSDKLNIETFKALKKNLQKQLATKPETYDKPQNNTHSPTASLQSHKLPKRDQLQLIADIHYRKFFFLGSRFHQNSEIHKDQLLTLLKNHRIKLA